MILSSWMEKPSSVLIGKETLALWSWYKSEYRISNHECRMSKECILSIFIKRQSDTRRKRLRCASDPTNLQSSIVNIQFPDKAGSTLRYDRLSLSGLGFSHPQIVQDQAHIERELPYFTGLRTPLSWINRGSGCWCC
jgi:hypothetical protein